MDLVFRCTVDWCDFLEFKESLCQRHYCMKKKYGEATPVVKCLWCSSTFVYSKSGTTRGNKWCCDECDSLFKKYEHRICKQPHSHGLNKIQMIKMIVAQDFRCMICGTQAKEKSGRAQLYVDHDHACCPYNGGGRSCGKCIRGLVCNGCNQAIALYENNRELFVKIKAYLEQPAKVF